MGAQTAWRLPSHQQPGPSVGGRRVLFTDSHLHTGTKVHSNQRKGTLRHPRVPFPGRNVRKHAAWEVFPAWTLVLVRGLCFSCESVPRVKAPWLPGLCRGSECACSVCNLGVLIPRRVVRASLLLPVRLSGPDREGSGSVKRKPCPSTTDLDSLC